VSKRTPTTRLPFPQYPATSLKGYARDLKDRVAFLQLPPGLADGQLQDLAGWPGRASAKVRDACKEGRLQLRQMVEDRAVLLGTTLALPGARCPPPDAVDTDRRDATVRLTPNPRRTPARGPDGWPGWTPAGCCCASSPTRPGLGAGASSTSPWGFGPTVTMDR
jgi:hypothetical protein